MANLDFSAIALELLAGNGDRKTILARLKRRCPVLSQQLEVDHTRQSMLRLWGDSVNIDESTGTVIVPVPIIETLGELAGVEMRPPVVHAGVTHTYGYLFSLIDTPYGQKRDRWTQGQVARILGIPDQVFSPQPRDGTLLGNVTYAVGRIAFRGRTREQRRLRSFRADVAAELQDFAYARLCGHRIVETISQAHNSIQLHTDLIESADSRHAMRLLVYWWSDNRENARLITAFPISPDFIATLLAPERFATNVEIMLRYNGHVPALNRTSQRTHFGIRQLYARGTRFRRIA